MKYNIAVIIPVGHLDGLDKTVDSFYKAANYSDKVCFYLILVFNNNIMSTDYKDLPNIENLKVERHDINPICSRSKSRNHGINFINKINPDYVYFIDAGDHIIPEKFHELEKTFKNYGKINLLIVNQTLIKINNQLSHIPLYPLFLRKIVNPFIMGGVVISKDLVENSKFEESYKEDWIYWDQILEKKPRIVFSKLTTSIYDIEELNRHINKKYNSFKDCRAILRNSLGWGNAISYPIALVHLIIITIRFVLVLLRSKIGNSYD